MAVKRMTGKENAAPEPEERETIRICVRSLVEFILRSGDIDHRGGDMQDPEAMWMGSRIHRKIQSAGGADYQAEVPLAATFDCGDFLIRVEGRADGIITKRGKPVVIEEIKGVRRSLDLIEEPVPVHLAQAKCYAYFYSRGADAPEKGMAAPSAAAAGEERTAAPMIGTASEEGPAVERARDAGSTDVQRRMDVRMTYVNMETEEKKYFRYSFTRAELEEWFDRVLEAWKKWARFEHEWHRVRTESIHRTEFPFPYREGQRKLAADVYHTISRGKILFIQAPTGVGKTLSTVFPAVKAMGEGLGETMFYLTARTPARAAAQLALDQLRGQGLRFKSVVLTAKEKICPMEKVSCNPEDCPYAKGHFDRINDALYELLTGQDSFTRETVEAAAKHFMVCPFELSLDLSSWMDGVICDYNYVFHPRARLKRFFGDGVKGDYLLLVDEAHNLVDRGRDMFSAALDKEDILAARKEIKAWSPALFRALGQVNRQMLSLKRACAENGLLELRSGASESGREHTDGLDALVNTLMNLSGTMSDFLDETKPGGRRSGAVPEEVRDQIRELYFQVTAFLDTCDLLDDHYMVYAHTLPDGKFQVKLLCVNPAANLQACMDRARSTILFSATFLPMDYYGSLLTTSTEKYAVYAGSVFDPAHLMVCVGTDTTSRYSQRGPAVYEQIASYIRAAVEAREGNYMVFFPSYKMMEEAEAVYQRHPARNSRTILQSRGMDEKERDAFLQAFNRNGPGSEEGAADGGQTGEDGSADGGQGMEGTVAVGGRQDESAAAGSLVGFCVMGSIFSEGIDLQADRLIGAIIVGTGLPMVSREQELLRQYYDRQGLDGFRYAYQCPGMTRVLQAAGRVIRTEQDRGIVLLLDERFTYSAYRSMFPGHWQQPLPVRADNVAGYLARFWRSQG